MYAFGRLPLPFLRLEPQLDMDALDDQHLPLELDLSGRFARQEALTCINLTRLQRASEGPGQSTGGRRYDVVEGRGMLLELAGRELVVLGNGAMDAEYDRLLFGR